MSDFLTDPLWYKDAVIYELHVRSFYDANNDGFGEFKGLREKLPYLEQLGVNTLWLLPFLDSPLRDDGYDTADYYKTLPVHGSVDDFKAFLDDAHSRGMRVITELVLNHTSDQHPWFQEARDPQSDKHDWYVWSDTDDTYDGVRIIFTDTEPSNWTWDAKAQKYYWHRFFSHQPDLNFDNPDVRAEMERVTFFWLDMGVDGLRLDAVPYLFEREGTSCENLPETLDYLVDLRRAIEARYGPGKVMLAEANQWPEDTIPYFAGGEGVQMAFNFPVMPRLYLALQRENRRPIVEMLKLTEDIPDDAQWAIFLRNHDELTLEMVTDEERDFMYNAYAADSRFRINVGIRRRLAPLLGGDRRRIELLNGLLLSMKGSPVLYYGDEIGMGDDPFLGDRNGVRTPMQWSPDKNGGFSRAEHHRLFMPAINRGAYSYEFVNVEDAERDPTSLLHWTRSVLAARKRHAAVFGRGTFDLLDLDNPAVFAYVRRYRDEAVLVVANLSRFAQSAVLPQGELSGFTPVELLGQTPFPPIGDAPYALTLAPYGFFWFRLDPVIDQAHASDRDEPGTARPADLPTVRVAEGLHNVLVPTMTASTSPADLERVLPDFLVRQRWYGAKSAGAPTVRLRDAVRLQNGELPVYLSEIEVTAGGHATRYQIPLMALPESEADAFLESYGSAAVCFLDGPNGKRLLVDGTQDERFWTAFVRWWQKGAKGRSLQGLYVPRMDKLSVDTSQVRVLRSEQSNSSAIVGGELFVKLFRRLEEGHNPEAELLGHLSETNFAFAPTLRGTLTFERPDTHTTLALAQQALETQSDGWAYALDLTATFFDRAEGYPLPTEDAEARAATVDELAAELMGFTRLLGVRTAEMHCALAESDADALVPAAFEPSDAAALAARVRRVLQDARSILTDDAGLKSAALDRALDSLDELESVSEGCRIRVHGDYHLGQTLVGDGEVYVLDFEGEPARPLDERRSKDSPLRDVAGMLRSLDYAVYMTQSRLEDRDDPDADARWAELLSAALQDAFVDAYFSVPGIGELLPGAAYRLPLLRLYLLEKALYELGYERDHRPDWQWLPAQALSRMLTS
jgi:maltose alpha-D-glucosyltransferase/alpha-amylase